MVRLHPLTRLRLAFAVLALVLLGPLGWLLWTAHARLATQRHLRHQVVAERIFDELERELTAVLTVEAERASEDYDRFTTASAWAPFIVGYFSLDGTRAHFSAGEQLSAARVSRLDWALSQLRQTQKQKASLADEVAPVASSLAPSGVAPNEATSAARTPSFTQPSVRTGSAVLRQLNRGSETRQRSSPSPKRQADPMYDYGY